MKVDLFKGTIEDAKAAANQVASNAIALAQASAGEDVHQLIVLLAPLVASGTTFLEAATPLLKQLGAGKQLVITISLKD